MWQAEFDYPCHSGNTLAYDGFQHRTVNGNQCQSWSKSKPHVPKRVPLFESKNYCRNPDFDINGPWCYTTNPNIRWEYCSVEICEDPSQLIFVTFDEMAYISFVAKMSANPEIKVRDTNTRGYFDMGNVTIEGKSSDR